MHVDTKILDPSLRLLGFSPCVLLFNNIEMRILKNIVNLNYLSLMMLAITGLYSKHSMLSRLD